MTCREIAEFLGDYFDGGLDPRVLGEFERHVRLCSDCLAYVDSYRETVRLGKASAAGKGASDEAPASVPDGLVRAILEARKKAP